MVQYEEAEYDGTELSFIGMATVPQGAYKTRVNGTDGKRATVYYASSNWGDPSTWNERKFVAVFSANVSGSAVSWMKVPPEINARRSANLSSYLQEVMAAPVAGITAPEQNLDDSFSLRDIAEFHPEIATVDLPREYRWIDENTLEPMNGYLTYESEDGWTAAFVGTDGSEVVVHEDERFVTGSRVTLERLQNATAGAGVTTYTEGELDSEAEPFAYTDENPFVNRETIDEWEGTSTDGLEFFVRLVRFNDNIETEANEAANPYRVETRVNGPTDGRIGINEGYAVNRWIWSSGSLSTQEEGQTAFDAQVSNFETLIAEHEQYVLDVADEALEGVVWTVSYIGGPFSFTPGEEITYTLTYTGDGKYRLDRGTLAIKIIEASSKEEAIAEANAEAMADSSPEAESYSPRSWMEYVDTVDAYRLDPEKYPLPDWCPFWDLHIKGSYSWTGIGGHRPEDTSKRSLMLDDKDDLGTPSGAVRLRLRAGYSVGFVLDTENAHYFHANMKGVSGTWANPEVESLGDAEVEIDAVDSVMISPNDTVTFNLKAATHEDAYIEIDLDSEWTHIAKFKIASLGEVITIDEPAKVDDEVFLRVQTVAQYSGDSTDPTPSPGPDPDPPNGGGENGDLMTGLAILAAVGVALFLLVRFTAGGGEE